MNIVADRSADRNATHFAEGNTMKTLLAIGAHYDDCIFGVPGILLQGVRKNYRVVALHLIGDYSNWPPAKGRDVAKMTTELLADRGVESQFLDFASHRYDARLENQIIVAEAVAKIKPDVALSLWKEDNHNDHIVASELSRIALRHAGRILGDESYRPPRDIYFYDNGPRHTIGFQPNTFVDVTDQWDEAMQWLGRLNAWVRQEPWESGKPIGSMATKESLARYRGATCGARYAEALSTPLHRKSEIL
jgi:LmbE family N-acetylglucosaminyl deacetylase